MKMLEARQILMHLKLSFMSLQKDGESVMSPHGHCSTERIVWSLKQGGKD